MKDEVLEKVGDLALPLVTSGRQPGA